MIEPMWLLVAAAAGFWVGLALAVGVGWSQHVATTNRLVDSRDSWVLRAREAEPELEKALDREFASQQGCTETVSVRRGRLDAENAHLAIGHAHRPFISVDRGEASTFYRALFERWYAVSWNRQGVRQSALRPSGPRP